MSQTGPSKIRNHRCALSAAVALPARAGASEVAYVRAVYSYGSLEHSSEPRRRPRRDNDSCILAAAQASWQAASEGRAVQQL